MTRADLEEIIRDIFDLDDVTLQEDTNIREVENWTSFNHIEMMIAVEEAASISLGTEEIQNLDTFGALSKAVIAKGGSFSWD